MRRKSTKHTGKKTKHLASVSTHAFPILAAIVAIVLAAALFYLYQLPTESSAKTTDSFELGEYYFNTNNNPHGAYDLRKAREAYTQALVEDPRGNPLTWYQLGRIDFLQGRFISALYKFDKQIEYFGDSVPNVYYMIGLASAYQAQISNTAEDWDRAEQGFIEYLARDPESPWAHVDLSWVYFSQGKYEEMLPPLEEGIASAPEHAWLLNMYGLALFNTGKKQQALASFSAALAAAEKLTTEDWGRAYPGNNPREWQTGLDTFRDAIRKNITLAS